MTLTGEGIFSRDTDSFNATIVAGRSNVSEDGDAINSSDMMTELIIAEAKFRNN